MRSPVGVSGTTSTIPFSSCSRTIFSYSSLNFGSWLNFFSTLIRRLLLGCSLVLDKELPWFCIQTLFVLIGPSCSGRKYDLFLEAPVNSPSNYQACKNDGPLPVSHVCRTLFRRRWSTTGRISLTCFFSVDFTLLIDSMGVDFFDHDELMITEECYAN